MSNNEKHPPASPLEHACPACRSERGVPCWIEMSPDGSPLGDLITLDGVWTHLERVRLANRWIGEAREAQRVLDELAKLLGHNGAADASLIQRAVINRDVNNDIRRRLEDERTLWRMRCDDARGKLALLERQLADACQEREAVDRALICAGSPLPGQQGVALLKRQLVDAHQEREAVDRALVYAGSTLPGEQGVVQLHRELAVTRSQRDGAIADLHHERCTNQGTSAEAAARELRLTEERNTAHQRLAELEGQIAKEGPG